MRFEVTILGSNSALPSHGRNQTSQLINIGLSVILLDCGEGTQIQLRRFKLKYSKIDYILISHLHGDHFYGLMGMISSFNLNNRTKLLTIFGPKGLDEIITIQLKYTNTRLNYPLRFVVTDPEKKELIVEENNYKIYSFPLKHRVPCTGFLIKEKQGFLKLIKEKLIEKKIPVEAIHSIRSGKDFKDPEENMLYTVSEYAYPPEPLRAYAYCSDTRFEPDLVPYIEDATLLYHESTFLDKDAKRAKQTFHSTTKQAAKIASMAGVNKLLLGHYSTRYVDLNPLLDEAREVFEESYLSEEGVSYDV